MLRLFAALLVLVWSTAAFPAKHGNFDQPDRPDASHAVDSAPLAFGAPEGSEPAAAGSIAGCTTDKEGLEQVVSCAKATWNFAFGSAERAIATFAGILAASTLLLWFNTRRAANAARIAAEQIRSVERAYLFAAPTNITLDDTRTETTVHIRVDNPGRTPGILTLVYGQFSKKPPQGENPVYEGGGSKAFELVVNSSNGAGAHDPAANVILPVTFKIDFADPIHFWGYVEYLDILKKPHTTRFCALIYPAQGKWEIAGGRAWNDWG
ncbi:MAG TPA: hypothetical protein VF340_07470 [Methyloceanibacter sp.]